MSLKCICKLKIICKLVSVLHVEGLCPDFSRVIKPLKEINRLGLGQSLMS